MQLQVELQVVTSCSFMDFTLALEALAEVRRAEVAGDSAAGIWNTPRLGWNGVARRILVTDFLAAENGTKEALDYTLVLYLPPR